MAQLCAFGRSLLCVAVLASPALAQDDDRIWGQLHTTSGDVYEGFIRWDRNEGSWVDILDGSRCGGERVQIPFGISFFLREGPAAGHRLLFEWYYTVHEDLNGPQLSADRTLVVSWQTFF